VFHAALWRHAHRLHPRVHDPNSIVGIKHEALLPLLGHDAAEVLLKAVEQGWDVCGWGSIIAGFASTGSNHWRRLEARRTMQHRAAIRRLLRHTEIVVARARSY
jgi:hypothetical protein